MRTSFQITIYKVSNPENKLIQWESRFTAGHTHPNSPVSYPQHPKLLKLELLLKHKAAHRKAQYTAPGAAAHRLSVLLSTALSKTTPFLQ